MTIAEAAQNILKNSDRALSIQGIYDEVIRQNLYRFSAKKS